jgi:hypothetical protein
MCDRGSMAVRAKGRVVKKLLQELGLAVASLNASKIQDPRTRLCPTLGSRFLRIMRAAPLWSRIGSIVPPRRNPVTSAVVDEARKYYSVASRSILNVAECGDLL